MDNDDLLLHILYFVHDLTNVSEVNKRWHKLSTVSVKHYITAAIYGDKFSLILLLRMFSSKNTVETEFDLNFREVSSILMRNGHAELAIKFSRRTGLAPNIRDVLRSGERLAIYTLLQYTDVSALQREIGILGPDSVAYKEYMIYIKRISLNLLAGLAAGAHTETLISFMHDMYFHAGDIEHILDTAVSYGRVYTYEQIIQYVAKLDKVINVDVYDIYIRALSSNNITMVERVIETVRNPPKNVIFTGELDEEKFIKRTSMHFVSSKEIYLYVEKKAGLSTFELMVKIPSVILNEEFVLFMMERKWSLGLSSLCARRFMRAAEIMRRKSKKTCCMCQGLFHEKMSIDEKYEKIMKLKLMSSL